MTLPLLTFSVLWAVVSVSSSIQPISNKVITEGVNLTLSCHQTGIPLPTVFWVKNSAGQHTNGTELVFRNIRRSEAGEYRCEARNPCGDASESATIDVQCKSSASMNVKVMITNILSAVRMYQ